MPAIIVRLVSLEVKETGAVDEMSVSGELRLVKTLMVTYMYM